MNGLLDDALVALILLAGFGYAGYALGPKVLRARMLATLATIMGRLPEFLGTRALAVRLAEKIRLGAGGTCAGCDNCGTDSAPTTPPGLTPEVRVPVAKIGKRH